jgi:hypothetical protein
MEEQVKEKNYTLAVVYQKDELETLKAWKKIIFDMHGHGGLSIRLKTLIAFDLAMLQSGKDTLKIENGQ